MKFSSSLCLSIIVHIFLLSILGFSLSKVWQPRKLVQLDLSSVELSFSEKDSPEEPLNESQLAQEEKLLRTIEMPKELSMPLLQSDSEVKISPPEVKPEIEYKEQNEELLKEKLSTLEDQERSTPQLESPQLSSAPQQARVIAQPISRRMIRPKYPLGARRRGESGDVVLHFQVSSEGKAEDIVVFSSSGFKELDDAAVTAVREAEFIPAKENEISISASAQLKLTFQLKK